jgi:hypothetical protein
MTALRFGSLPDSPSKPARLNGGKPLPKGKREEPMTQTVEQRRRVAECIAFSCGWNHAGDMRAALVALFPRRKP